MHWWDAQDTSSLVLNGPSEVDRWDDKEGSVNLVATSDNLTIAGEQIGGKQTIDLTVGRFQPYAAINGVAAVAAVVARATGDNDCEIIDTADDAYEIRALATRMTFNRAETVSGTVLQNGDLGAFPAEATSQTISTTDGEGDLFYVKRTGGFAPTYTSSAFDTENGLLGEILFLSADLSTTNRRILEGYLAHRWNLVAKLPIGHPYKLAPPTI